MNSQDRSNFVGKDGPEDWLRLKQAVFDIDALKRENFFSHIRSRPNTNYVLDCGTGEGDFAAHLYLLTNAKLVIGVDIFRKYLITAIKKQNDLPLTYQEANVYMLPFADESFDLVGMQSTFDLLNGDMAMQEMLRVLKPGGWLYISMAYDSSYPWSPIYDESLELEICLNIDAAAEREMIDGVYGGDSRAGRKLWHYAYKYGLEVIEFTSSDWILYPKPIYSSQQKAALRVELEFFYKASLPSADPPYSIDPESLADWYKVRQQQIENNLLVFIEHQNSLIAEKPIYWNSKQIRSDIELTPKYKNAVPHNSLKP